jgi:hypothetical protein
MTRAIAKQTFNAPTPDVLDAIDASDKCAALEAALYRYQAQLTHLTEQYEHKVSTLRFTYLKEVEEIQAQ